MSWNSRLLPSRLVVYDSLGIKTFDYTACIAWFNVSHEWYNSRNRNYVHRRISHKRGPWICKTRFLFLKSLFQFPVLQFLTGASKRPLPIAYELTATYRGTRNTTEELCITKTSYHNSCTILTPSPNRHYLCNQAFVTSSTLATSHSLLKTLFIMVTSALDHGLSHLDNYHKHSSPILC